MVFMNDTNLKYNNYQKLLKFRNSKVKSMWINFFMQVAERGGEDHCLGEFAEG